ncbi:MAG: hypothetical protein HC806_10135 [Anaerolineae bacterium]|nr:hypothetical protein [Anaerolineae bacterium]
MVVYAGLERLSSNGNSHVDIELNQATIELDKSIPCDLDQSDGVGDGSPCEFIGERMVNDMLFVMDFENGGKFGSVQIFKWSGVTWIFEEALSGEGCNLADTICAFNNSAAIDGGPWLNYDKHGPVEVLKKNAFSEFGFNVTELLKGETPCFATVQVKSRSSSSFLSELKDFSLGNFNTCAPPPQQARMSISEGGTNEVRDAHTFIVTVEYLKARVWTPLGNVTVQGNLDAQNGSNAFFALGDTCVTGNDGTCSLVVNSSIAGQALVWASADIELPNGSIFPSETEQKTKTWVDATISIGTGVDTFEYNDKPEFCLPHSPRCGIPIIFKS